MSTAPRHLPGLDNANVVKTKTVASAEHKLSSSINRHGIAVVSGAPGNGKSFTVDQFLNTHPSVAGRTVHWLDMPPNPAPKEVMTCPEFPGLLTCVDHAAFSAAV